MKKNILRRSGEDFAGEFEPGQYRQSVFAPTPGASRKRQYKPLSHEEKLRRALARERRRRK